MMMLAAAVSMQAMDAPRIPEPGQSAYAAYVGCVSEPLMDLLQSGKPEDKAARQALYDGAIAKCAATRSKTSAEMDTKLAKEPGWTEAAVRKDKIEDILSRAEQRVAFGTVNREEMLARTRAYMTCLGQNPKSEASCTF